jgi:hypothetical protein
MLALTEELICGLGRSEGCDDEMVRVILIAVGLGLRRHLILVNMKM